MSITGGPDEAGGEPTKVGVAIADVVTGLHGAVAVLAALSRAGRRRWSPGAGRRGQRIDVSILESTLAVLVNQAQNAFATGRRADPARQRPSQHRPVRDVRHGRRRDRGRRRLGAPVVAVLRRPRAGGRWRPIRASRRMPARVAKRAELRPILADAACRASRPRPGSRRLEAAEVPCGADQRRARGAGEPTRSAARDMVVDVEHPRLGPIRQVGVPFKLAATPATIRSAPPLLGEQTDEVLAELGYDADESRPPAGGRGRSELRRGAVRAPGDGTRATRPSAASTIRTDAPGDRRGRARRRRGPRSGPSPGRAPAPSRPGGRKRPDDRDRRDERQTDERRRRRSPAAAAAEPNTVEARNVIAAQLASPSQERTAQGRPSRRSAPARTGSPCRSSRRDGDRACASARTTPRPTQLGAEEAPRGRPAWSGGMRPCRAPSRSATAPIARTIAANAPSWPRFFWSWSTASAGVGVGIGIVSWSPRAALRISGR